MKPRLVSQTVLKQLIKRFQTKDPAVTTIDDYMTLFGKIITYFPFPIFVVPAEIKMHRIRVHSDNQDFNYLKELWCPPAEFVTKIGRCNDIGDQILYVSGGGHTSIRELNPLPGSLISCLECQLISPLNAIEIGVLKNNTRETYLQQYAAIHRASIAQAHGNDPKLIKLDNRLKNFIISEFTKIIPDGQDFRYKVTAAIAKQFFMAKQLDAIMYPSIKSDLLEINHAIPIKVAEKKLKPIRVDVFRYVPTEEHPSKIELLKGAYSNLNFVDPLIYTEAQPLTGWASPL